MAGSSKYTGMTYTDIVNLTLTIAKKFGFEIERSEVIALFDEAAKQVMNDFFEGTNISTIAYPTGTDTIVDTYGEIKDVYGDNEKFIKLDYDQFSDMFLGPNSTKPDIDTNHYWTYKGGTIYLEPGLTGYTNVNIDQETTITKIANASDVSDIPEIPDEYRIFVCYKIIEMLSPAKTKVLTRQVYKDQKKDKKAQIDRKYARGQAVFWDPFE